MWMGLCCRSGIFNTLLILYVYMFRNQPYYSCPTLNVNGSTAYRELRLKNKTDCSVVAHVKEEYRQHGIVLVYLSKV